MVTIQTFVIYTLLFFSMFMLCKNSTHKTHGGFIWPLLAVTVYAVIFGLRYGVGVDHIGYIEDIIADQARGYIDYSDETELGFRTIRSFFSLNDFHYSWFFGFISFAQLLFVFLAVKKDHRVHPYLALSFSLMCIWLSYANGLRQELAFCIFTYALSLATDKKNIGWIALLLALAISMHKSAYLLIAVITPCLLFKTEWFKNVKWQFFFLLIALILGQLPLVQSLDKYINILEYIGYEVYLEEEFSDLIVSSSSQRGLGFYILLMIDIIIIALSNNVKSYCKSKFLNRAYDLYFLGVITHYALLSNSLIQRVNYYFYGFNFIVMAYTLFALGKTNKKLYYVALAMLALYFIGHLYRMYDNTAAYYFFWQQDLYHLTH